MPTLTMKATEMQDATVQRISLVTRAATRLPIKVIKGETPMSILNKSLDLANVFKGDKKNSGPVVVGVATMKSEDMTGITKVLEEAGFKVQKSEDLEDGSTVFPQVEGATFEDTTVIRMNDNVALAMKAFKPWSLDFEVEGGASFSELCAAQGFYPGISTLLDVLHAAILHSAENATNPADAAKEVGKMFDQAKAYTMGLVNALPSKAFKLESLEPEVAVKGEQQSADLENQEGTTTVANPEPAPAPAAKAEDATVTDPVVDPAAATAAETTASQEPAATSAPAPAAKAEADPLLLKMAETLAGLAKKMDTVTESVSGVTKEVANLSQGMQDLSGRVDGAEKVAKAAHEALEGTVVLGSGGDAGDRTQAVKSDKSSSGREIDTAYARRPRRV